jgi:hypothetical protein
MKNILIGLFALAAVTVGAQEYKSRQPYPSEVEKLAGVTDYIQDGPRYNFTLYRPGQDEQYTLQPYHNVVAFRSNSQLTNVVVILPNPTNSLRRSYRLIANGNVTIKLTNTVGATYNTATNVTALSTFTSATNSAFLVYNNDGTNWFISPY